jgi:hypothetical protein
VALRHAFVIPVPLVQVTERCLPAPLAVTVVDQGSQFTSKERDLWAYADGITLGFSRPGKPTDKVNGEFACPKFALSHPKNAN